MGDAWSTPGPGRFTPGKETRYPLYGRLSGSQGRSGQMRKISPPTGIRSPDRPDRSESLYRLRYPYPRSVGRRLARSPLLDRSKSRCQRNGTAGWGTGMRLTSPNGGQFTESNKERLRGRWIVILLPGMCSVYWEQRVCGRTEKCEDVQNDLGQTFIENLRSHEITDKGIIQEKDRNKERTVKWKSRK